MNILSFEKKHVKEATALALANYYDERQFVKELPEVYDIPDLNAFTENGTRCQVQVKMCSLAPDTTYKAGK